MVKPKGNKKSKRTKLSLKYNIQKRVRENKRRLRKEAKKLGGKKPGRKDPGIPNTWPFKAQMLQDLEQKKEEREKELEARRQEARQKSKSDREAEEAERQRVQQEREAERRQKRAEEAENQQREALRRSLEQAVVILLALDARDPHGCRCDSLETWARENGKRLVFVLTKADLVAPQTVAQWMTILGAVAPVVAVQAEAGRDGVRELLEMLGHFPGGATSSSASRSNAEPAASGGTTMTLGHKSPAAAEAVGVVGYANTGRKALCKAIQQEMKSPVRWLLFPAGRLRPTPGPQDDARTLHLALRAALPPGTRADETCEPMAVVKHLLARVPQHSIMRRFRLPEFDDADGFLNAFAKDRDIKSKRGNAPGVEAVARRLLSELPVMPGCICSPPEKATQLGSLLWEAHAVAQEYLKTIMQAQIEKLRTRSAGSAAGALCISTNGMGPNIDMKSIFETKKDEDVILPGDEDHDFDDGDDDDAEGEEEDLEDGEEEIPEDEESEDDDMED